MLVFIFKYLKHFNLVISVHFSVKRKKLNANNFLGLGK